MSKEGRKTDPVLEYFERRGLMESCIKTRGHKHSTKHDRMKKHYIISVSCIKEICGRDSIIMSDIATSTISTVNYNTNPVI